MGMLTISAGLFCATTDSMATVISSGARDPSESKTHVPLTVFIGAGASPLMRVAILELVSVGARGRFDDISSPRIRVL